MTEKYMSPFTGKKDSPYVFGIRGMDEMFERLYKRHGAKLKKMFKGKSLSPDDAFSVLQHMEANPDKSYLELKEDLLPSEKQKLSLGGKAYRGRKAAGSAEKAR